MYVDGINMGAYYPYTWDESAISNPGPGTVTWGSGSSGGQSHLRWNWVEFSILTHECKRDYFMADVVPEDALVFLDASNPESLDPTVSSVPDEPACVAAAAVAALLLHSAPW